MKWKRKTYFEKHVSNPNRKQKDKNIMTIFLKAQWEIYYHGQLRNWSWNIASLFT
jgi:hypothetical protein